MNGISDLIRERLCIILVQPSTKRPIPSRWQQRTAKDNNLNDFSPDTNAGVVLRKTSGSVVDISLDKETVGKVTPYRLSPSGWAFGRKNTRASFASNE